MLPGRSDVTVDHSGNPQLLCIDDERTSNVLAALSSDTSRSVFEALNSEPMAAKDVADELDMSVQSISYHLGNLQDAGLIEVLDTCYSEKGQEMDIYGPAEEPMVLFLGHSEDRPGLVSAFRRIAGAIGPIGIAIAIGGKLTRLFGLHE
jgi:DNA-binding transcriptional ArsR family regulator